MEVRDARRLAVLAGAFPALDTAVNIAFPAIDEHFDLDVADLQWIVVTYLFTYAALLVPAGWLGDRIGHRQLVFAGAAVSVVGVAGCAAAPKWGLFLVARVVQGAGTAMLYAGSPALLTTSAEPGARATAVSWFQAASMVGLTIGPLIGGPLVAWAGWRSVYAFRIPVAIALGLLALRGSRAETPEPAASASSPWSALGDRDFRRANVVNALANAAMFPTWLLVPSLLVDELGVAVVAAGIVLAASPACSAVGSLWVGRQLRERDPTTMARLGLGILVAGLVLLAALGPAGGSPSNLAAIIVGIALVGAGIAIFAVPNMHVVMASLPLDRQGVAGGISVMTRTMGVVFGVLAAGAAFDTLEAERGFDSGFRIIFAAAALIAVAAIALTRQPAPTTNQRRRPGPTHR